MSNEFSKRLDSLLDGNDLAESEAYEFMKTLAAELG